GYAQGPKADTENVQNVTAEPERPDQDERGVDRHAPRQRKALGVRAVGRHVVEDQRAADRIDDREKRRKADQKCSDDGADRQWLKMHVASGSYRFALHPSSWRTLRIM